ncbi:MAG: helix-turn-helix domain-containing protein [Saprospiraceae bacterium]
MEKKTKTEAKRRGRPAKKKPAGPPRRKYDTDTKAEAKDLYLRGVSLDRIGRYLGVPLRTLTNWQTGEHWTDAKDPAGAALELKERGYRLPEIAERLEVSEKTVRRWLNMARQRPA